MGLGLFSFKVFGRSPHGCPYAGCLRDEVEGLSDQSLESSSITPWGTSWIKTGHFLDSEELVEKAFQHASWTELRHQHLWGFVALSAGPAQ